MKCILCRENKTEGEFYPRKEVKGGLRRECKSCFRSAVAKRYFGNWEKNKKDRRELYHRQIRHLNIQRKHGISRESYQSLFDQQGGKCAICRGGMKWYLHIDHDHKTMKIRGLLCQTCNAGLGCFKDNPQFLSAAITYLNKGASSPKTEKGESNGNTSKVA